jgi:Tfp pilus assembly protein PilF
MKAVRASSGPSKLSHAAIVTDARMASIVAAPTAQKVPTASARQFLGLGRLDLAESLIERALADDECCHDAQTLLADIIDRRGDRQGSLARLRRGEGRRLLSLRSMPRDARSAGGFG